MRKFQCLLFVLKWLYIFCHIICMTVPLRQSVNSITRKCSYITIRILYTNISFMQEKRQIFLWNVCIQDQTVLMISLSKQHLVKVYMDLAQKTFKFSRKPCLFSVIFIKRQQLKKIVVIVTRKFCLLQSYGFNRKLCLLYFLELYI